MQSVSSAATSYLAAQANEQLGRDPLGTDAITGTQFTIDSVTFATAEDDKTPLAVVQAHFSGGGPLTTLALYHDSGSVPRYSLMFMARVTPVVRDPSAAARPRREEAQGVPDRRERARVVRPRVGEGREMHRGTRR